MRHLTKGKTQDTIHYHFYHLDKTQGKSGIQVVEKSVKQ